MLRLIRYVLFVTLLVVRFLLALVTAKEIAFTDPNEDVKRAWCLLNDDTQPIPVVRSNHV